MKSNHWLKCLSAFMAAITLATQPCAASGAGVEESYAIFLSEAGYRTDSINGLIRATEDQNTEVRMVATTFLARRYGQQSPDSVLPVLRKVSQDPAVVPRVVAAYWMAKLGDTSGAEILKRAYLDWVPGGSDPQRCGEVERDHVRDALWIGEMLAEFGDPIGLALASHVVNAEGFDKLRFAGARVLGALPCSGNVCSDEAKRAIEALEGLASRSEDPSVLGEILGATQRQGFPERDRTRIQKMLDNSGRLPAHMQAARTSAREVEKIRSRGSTRNGIASRPAPVRREPRALHLEPSELELRISHRETRVFHLALRGGSRTCAVKEVLSDEPGIEASAREEPEGKGYIVDVTVKETAPQNRTSYVFVRLEGCGRPFVVLPIKFFRQVATRPANNPATRPASRPE